jgi:lipooligosaccharide transport system ATP-binding protein
MQTVTPMLEARGLIKHLGGRRVVDGVDLVCLPGQIHGLLGPNGAGKTTTLRMLYGFLTPDGGEIRFEGADVREDLEAAKRYIGVCTQDDSSRPRWGCGTSSGARSSGPPCWLRSTS